MKKILFVLAIALFAVSCEKEESKPPMTVKNNNLILFHDKSEQLIVENNLGNVSYKSENKLVANVSDEGIVEGNVRGKTTILVSSLDETSVVNVEVKTLINFLPEPYLGFGDDYESVKARVVAGGKITESTNGFFTEKRIDNSDVIYYYVFENKRLHLSMFGFRTLSNISAVISDFLLERYIPVGQTGAYSAALISPEKDVAVFLSASNDNSFITVGYMKFEGEEVAQAKLRDEFDKGIENIFENID